MYSNTCKNMMTYKYKNNITKLYSYKYKNNITKLYSYKYLYLNTYKNMIITMSLYIITI